MRYYDSWESAVSLDLVMELVEMQAPGAKFDEVAITLGVSTASLTRYRKHGVVPREVAERLYDRIALGLGRKKPKTSSWEYPMDYDERSELGRKYYKQAS